MCSFNLDAGARDDDLTFEREGVALVVDAVSYEFVRGASIDFVDSLIKSTFEVLSVAPTLRQIVDWQSRPLAYFEAKDMLVCLALPPRTLWAAFLRRVLADTHQTVSGMACYENLLAQAVMQYMDG